jgi:O-antigen/teichoic acid export membrane protein
MLSAMSNRLKGEGIAARVMRGSALTVMGYGASMVLRLGSNLILTRLLFPEAFGLMAIVSLFLTGLQMFSDIGLQTGIVRSKRGNDPVFLNTCWTMQIMRGAILAAIAVAISGPAARFYEEPMLEEMLYVVAFVAFVIGFKSTRIATANKKILLGRLTMMDLACQVLSIIAMIVLAYLLESVWALVIGMVVQNISKTVLSHLVLPGHPNRLQLERDAFMEQFHFGKYLFVSSGLTFIIENGDRILLSKFLTLAYLGFFKIAFFFAVLPVTLMGQFVHRVVFPLYSARPPMESEANRKAIRKTRFALTGAMLFMLFVIGLLGQWMVEFMYTEEYWEAGPILVLLTVSLMPMLIIRTYPIFLLSLGKSGVYMGFQILRAVLQTGFLALGLLNYGVVGALAAQPVATLLMYPVLIWMIRPYKGHDFLHDIVFATLALLFAFTILWVNDEALARVMAIPVG